MGGFRVYGDAGRDALMGGVGGASSRLSLGGASCRFGLGNLCPGFVVSVSADVSSMACSEMPFDTAVFVLVFCPVPVQLLPTSPSMLSRRRDSSAGSIEVRLLKLLCILEASLSRSSARVVVLEDCRSGEEPFRRCDGTAERGVRWSGSGI